jgi:hypothetical protein
VPHRFRLAEAWQTDRRARSQAASARAASESSAKSTPVCSVEPISKDQRLLEHQRAVSGHRAALALLVRGRRGRQPEGLTVIGPPPSAPLQGIDILIGHGFRDRDDQSVLQASRAG